MSEATARRQRSRRELPQKPSRPGPSATVPPSSAVTKRAPRQNEAPSKLLDMNKMYSVAAGMDATRVPLEASSEATVAPTTSRDLPPGCDVDAYGELAQVLWSNPLDEAVRWVSTGRQWTPETSLEVLTGSRLPGMSTRAASSSSNGGRRRSASRDISPSSLLESVDAVDGARWSQLYHGLDDPTSTQWAGNAPVTSLSRPETIAAATASLAPPEAVYGDEKELVGVTSIAEGEDVGRTMDHDMPIHLNQDSGMHRTWDRARSPSRDTSTSMESSPLHQLLSDTGLDSRLDTGSTTSVGLRYYRQSPFARYDSPLRQPVFVEWSTGNTSVMPETNAAWQSLAPDMGTARENSPATRLVTPDIVTWSTERANAAGVDVSNRAAFSRPDEISEQAKIAHQTESKTLELKTESISRSLDEHIAFTTTEPGSSADAMLSIEPRVPAQLRAAALDSSARSKIDALGDIEALVADAQHLMQRLSHEDRHTIQRCLRVLSQRKRASDRIPKRSATQADTDASAAFVEAAETLILQLFFQSGTIESSEPDFTDHPEPRHDVVTAPPE